MSVLRARCSELRRDYPLGISRDRFEGELIRGVAPRMMRGLAAGPGAGCGVIGERSGPSCQCFRAEQAADRCARRVESWRGVCGVQLPMSTQSEAVEGGPLGICELQRSALSVHCELGLDV
jgi:hypothetical protein